MDDINQVFLLKIL